LRHTLFPYVTEFLGFELLTLPSVALFLTEDGLRIIKPKRLEIKHVLFESFFSVNETVKSIPVLCSKL